MNLRLLILFIALLLANSSNVFAKSKEIQKAGDVLRYLAPVTAAVGSLYIEDYNGVGKLAISIFLTQGISELTKKAFPKKRPDWEHGCPLNSFPSGHVASTFSAASYLRIRYDEPKFYIPAYTAAVFTAYSRVQARRHHVIDVITGAALAEIVSYFIVDKYTDIEITPVTSFENEQKFIGLSLKF